MMPLGGQPPVHASSSMPQNMSQNTSLTSSGGSNKSSSNVVSCVSTKHKQFHKWFIHHGR